MEQKNTKIEGVKIKKIEVKRETRILGSTKLEWKQFFKNLAIPIIFLIMVTTMFELIKKLM